MTRRPPVLVTALCAVPVLALAGCSGSSGSGGTAPASGSTASTSADQLQRMREKVDGAERAAASADTDATADDTSTD